MRKATEPEVIVVKRGSPSPLQKLYRTKKFKMGWAEFRETYEAGKLVGRREGLKEGTRRERKALLRDAKKDALALGATNTLCVSIRWIEDWLASRAKEGKK